MAADANSTKVVVAAMIGNGLIAVSKFTAAFFTGSASTLAEGVHSVADTVNQVLLLVGLRRSKRRPTALHPMGFAAEAYFWPFMVSIIMFLLGGVFALYEGIHGLLALGEHAGEATDKTWDYGVLGAAILFEAYVFSVAIKEFKKQKGDEKALTVLMRSKDPTIPVVLMEDAAALTGLVIAITAVGLVDSTGWHGWDAIGSCLIGVLLCFVSFFLARETYSLILGESATHEDRERVVSIVEADEAVEEVTQLLSQHRGPKDVLLALKVAFQRGQKVSELEAAIDRIEAAIREALPQMTLIFIEPDAKYDVERDELRADVDRP